MDSIFTLCVSKSNSLKQI